MKRLTLLTAAIFLTSLSATAGLKTNDFNKKRDFKIPAAFSTTGETKTMEWGCPIDNELVEAENRKSALNRLVTQCLEQASRAAKSKPNVAAVIQASVIAPDLAFREERKGLHVVNGTIFLETVVSMVRSAQ